MGSRPYRFHFESIIALASFTSQNTAYPLLHHSWLNQRMVISPTLVKPRAKAKDLFRLITQKIEVMGPVWIAGAQIGKACPRPPARFVSAWHLPTTMAESTTRARPQPSKTFSVAKSAVNPTDVCTN